MCGLERYCRGKDIVEARPAGELHLGGEAVPRMAKLEAL